LEFLVWPDIKTEGNKIKKIEMVGPEAQAHPNPNVFLFFYFFEAVSSSAGTDWARSSGLARYWPMPVTGPFLFVRRV
jgi:hypothetical protein